jgi:hypothetical protein
VRRAFNRQAAQTLVRGGGIVLRIRGSDGISFLHVSRLAGFTIAAYHDHAEGVMEEIAPGEHAVTKVVLHPQMEWVGEALDKANWTACNMKLLKSV